MGDLQKGDATGTAVGEQPEQVRRLDLNGIRARKAARRTWPDCSCWSCVAAGDIAALLAEVDRLRIFEPGGVACAPVPPDDHRERPTPVDPPVKGKP